MIFDGLDRIKSFFGSVFVERQFSVFEGLVRFITGETEGDREVKTLGEKQRAGGFADRTEGGDQDVGTKQEEI